MSRRSGFTLVEVLIAVGIIAVLVATLSVFVSQVAGTRVRLRERAAVESASTTVLDSIDDALATCIARAGDGSPGIVGDELSLTVSHDTTVIQRALDAAPASVLQSEDRLRVEFLPGSGRFALARGEASPRELEGAIHAVRLRYHDGSAWRTDWDSVRAGGLPRAIECSIWFAPWPDGRMPEWFPEESDLDDPESSDPLEDPIGEPAFDSLDELLEASESEGRETTLPEPDRRRIFAIPDAEQPDDSTFFDEPLLPQPVPGIEPAVGIDDPEADDA